MRTRLDVYLVERGYLDSRQKAQAVVMSGQVYVDGRRVDKPGAPGLSTRRPSTYTCPLITTAWAFWRLSR